ncbi:hypothetical protein LTR36_006772 [Oleoguttula mirabilis]|uniref:CID domain-containing protein n=1 Tax=Oleoguttula mirabilis TaxID=1507867 RepID=A0AAV9JBE7_9PEZI|nr:hypothetical protein LTR36_006772 [Oleoguttula mirabilis]
MAYSADAVRAKLASLNETQDSIVANAQWIMFHRRHADRTAHLWLERLQQAPHPKKLNLIYLANEVVQQSRARGKQDFMLAFEPIVAEATGVAYKGASQEVQGKIRRVVEVWRQRGIFDGKILDQVDGRMAELEKAKGAKGGAGKLGGSLFGGGGGAGGVPNELEAVSKSQAALSRVEVAKGPAVENAGKEYAKMTDTNVTLPTPPVHAARLSALMRNLATAQGAVEASIKARRELLDGLEKLVESNRTKLNAEEAAVADLSAKKEGIEAKKKEVEDGIMRGLSAPTSPTAGNTPTGGAQTNGTLATNGGAAEPAAPETEGFTPPPPDVESFTPLAEEEEYGTTTGDITASGDGGGLDYYDDPEPVLLASNPTGAENMPSEQPTTDFNEPPPAFEPPPAMQASNAANDFLANLNMPAQQQQPPMVRQASGELPAGSVNGNPGDPRLKRRKMSHRPSTDVEDGDIFGSGAAGVDEDGVAAMLAQ